MAHGCCYRGTCTFLRDWALLWPTWEPRKRMANKRDTDGHFYCMNFICFGRRDDFMNTLKVSGQPKRSIFSIKW